MPFNGSGTFTRVHDWTTDRNNGTKIEADRHDDEDDGFATGLSNVICKDGQSTPTANIPMGGFKITNLGDATTATDAVNRQTGDARYHPIGATTTTDNAIARYNGTAGALQNSGATIDDSNNVSALSYTAQSTDAGAADFSGYILDRFSASPAASDVLGSYVLRGRDSGGNSTDYASIRGVILDPTNTSEDGQVILYTLVGGAATAIMTWGPGVQIGAPTGGDKGAGTINLATGIYINNVPVQASPASTTDNAVARFDGTAGALQNSGIVIDDSNNATGYATVTLPNTGLHLLDTNASHDLIIKPGSDVSADRTLTITTGDADRTWTMTGNFTMSGAFNLTLTTTADTNVTLPTSGTLAVIGSDNNFTAGQTVTSTDAGASTFTAFTVNRNSATPANDDFIGKIIWTGRDNGAGLTTYAELDAQIKDTTDTSEDGKVILRTMQAGSMTDTVAFGPNDFNYSSGTFTPTVTLVGGAGNTTPVYSTNTGRYQRIGARVFVDIFLDGDGGNEGAGTGTFTVALPVTVGASFPGDPIPGGTFRNGTSEYIAYVSPSAGGTTAGLTYFDAATNRAVMTGAEQSNATRSVRLAFSYEV